MMYDHVKDSGATVRVLVRSCVRVLVEQAVIRVLVIVAADIDDHVRSANVAVVAKEHKPPTRWYRNPDIFIGYLRIVFDSRMERVPDNLRFCLYE